MSATRDAYVVGGYRDEHWTLECIGMSMPFTPPASVTFLLGDVYDASLRFLPGDVYDGH